MALYEYCGIRPTLADGVYIAPNASVIGDVHIGEHSSLWFGVVVRGDVYPIRIGARTNIQDNSVVHVTGGKNATSLGDDVTVGHMVLLHGCVVGHRCLIGMGSVVLDGAVIGDDSIVAAGSLVVPGTKIPPRSMAMGRPAKATRALSDDDLAWARQPGMVYVEMARIFQTEVHRID
ncbi:MAG: gamma carbonic anhydrase family protein [Myxococcales bacterium]|jgi:carbonic anhydrase/acetyltransferase-like protein (isoleucine patch superfamily)